MDRSDTPAYTPQATPRGRPWITHALPRLYCPCGKQLPTLSPSDGVVVVSRRTAVRDRPRASQMTNAPVVDQVERMNGKDRREAGDAHQRPEDTD